MGGYMSSPDKGHEAKLLDEYQEKLSALDDAAFGLFNAVDLMDDVASILEQKLQADIECTDQKENAEQIRKLAARLLTTSKCVLLHQKKLANVSLISLLNFIKDEINKNSKSADGKFRKLSIENFEDDRKLLDSEKETDRFKAMLNKIEEQTNEMKSLKDRIETFKKKESTFVEEEKLLREKILDLEKTVSEELKQQRKEINEMREENILLQSQLQKASSYKNERDKLRKDLEEMQSKSESLEKDKKMLEHSQENHQKCHESHTKEIAALEQANSNLEHDFRGKENALKEITEKYTTLKDVFEKHKQRCKEKKNCLKSDLYDLKQNISEKDKQKSDLEKEKDETIARHEKRMQTLDETVKKLLLEQEELKNTKKTYEDSLHCLTNELVEEKENKQCYIQKTDEEKRMLDKELEKLRNESSDMISKYESEIQNLKALSDKLAAEKDKKQLYIEKTENKNKQLVENLEKVRNESSIMLSKYESKIKNMNVLSDKLVAEKDEKQLYIEKTDNENKRLLEKLEKAQNTLSDMIAKYEKEIKQLKSLNLVDKNKLENQIDQAKQDRENLTLKVQELETELKIKDENIADQEKSLKELMKQERNLKSVTKEKDKDIRNLEKENKNLNDTLTAERMSVQNLKQTLKEKETAIKSQEKEITSLFAQLKDERDTILKLKKECASKNKELTDIKRHFLTLKECKEDLEKRHEHQSREIDSLQKELHIIKAKKRVPVQLYTQKRSELTDNVGEAIIRLLQKEFVSDRLELDFWKCSRISDIHQDYPLLVICITVSRIGTDVANAIHGISLSPNMAVMVFHHKDEHALPNQLSERILTGKELKDIGGIFDMAYFSGKGIYHCEMNRNSADSLVTFIKRVARNIHP